MTKLKVGQQAPAFEGKNQDGKLITLNDFRGRKLVIYFYPKDMTPGCTAQACSLRDHYDSLIGQGFAVLGVSMDSEKKHQSFIAKYELPFDLIADTDRKIIDAFGVWGPKKFMGREFDGIIRTTFVIDEEGMISEIIEKVNTKEHAGQIIRG